MSDEYTINSLCMYEELPDGLKTDDLKRINIVHYPDVMGLIFRIIKEKVRYNMIKICLTRDLELDFENISVNGVYFAICKGYSCNLTIKHFCMNHVAFIRKNFFDDSICNFGNVILDGCNCSLLDIEECCTLRSITVSNHLNTKCLRINGTVRNFVRGNPKILSLSTEQVPTEPCDLFQLSLSGLPDKRNPNCCNYTRLIINCCADVMDFTGLKMDRVRTLKIESLNSLEESYCIFDHDAFPKCVSLTTHLMQLPEFPSLRFLNLLSPKTAVLKNAEMLYGALQRPTLKVTIKRKPIDVDELLANIQQSGPKSARNV